MFPRVDPITYIQSRPEIFLFSAPACGAELVTRMAEHILLELDATVTCWRADDWWLVSCDVDWLTNSGGSMSNRFASLVAFPEAGDNSSHYEVVMTAYSTSMFTYASDQATIIKGAEPSAQVVQSVSLRCGSVGRCIGVRV